MVASPRKRKALYGVAVGFLLSAGIAAWWLLGRNPERVHRVYVAPDNSFQVVVSVTKQHWPYGVQGNYYLTDITLTRWRKVDDYFVDFLDDPEMILRWDEHRRGFVYIGKISGPVLINCETFPLAHQDKPFPFDLAPQ